MTKSTIPALAVAAEIADKDGILMLSTGYRAKIKPVSAVLLDNAMSRIKDPEIPEVYLEDKDRKEPNPNDPSYLKAMEEANHKRSMASVDVMILMGIQLIDPIPPDEDWLFGLQDLSRLGLFDLTPYDMTNPRDREFVFKRFVAVGNDDLKMISKKMGISEEDLKAAEAAFPGNKA